MNFFKEFFLTILKKYFVWFFIIIELLVIIILSILLMNKKDKSFEIENDIAYVDTSVVTDNYEYVIFDIKGAIKNPGVYKVEKGTIINDAITLAGGLNKNATTLNINLGKEVIDRMVIYISTKSELTKKVNNDLNKVVIENNNDNKIDNNESLIDNSNCVGIEVKQKEKELTKKEEVKKEVDDEKKVIEETNDLISINKATKEELTKIPSIGDAKAEKIISYREENGLFNNIEEIKNVSGIGEALFEKIKDYITV